MPPSPHGARVMQPVGWVLNEAAHPVASQYHRLVGDLDGAPAALSLLRARDCADLLFRYACLIHLAHRYAVLGENSAWEQRVLRSRLNPDTPLAQKENVAARAMIPVRWTASTSKPWGN